ncbi:MAG: DUF7683 domain-containing protein [Stellaceae bacterium]
MSRITHILVGYERLTERVAEEFDVPDAVLPRAKELACVPANDPEAVMCYPLDARRAHDLANILKANIDTERCDYFLEGFAIAEISYEFAGDAKFRSEPYSLEYSAWIHNDAKKDHIKVAIARRALDDYASQHGHEGYRAVLALLNARIKHQVQEIANRVIEDGRAMEGRLELNNHDLGAMLDG